MKTALILLWGTYLLLTSVYCILSYLPYTYYALIKSPPYDWMSFFVQHHASLYWLSLTMAVVVFWPKKRSWGWLLGLAGSLCCGLYLSARPALAHMQSDSTAYVWSLIPLLLTIALCVPQLKVSLAQMDESTAPSLISFRLVVPVALLVGIASAAGFRVRDYLGARVLDFPLRDVELTAWSVITHLVVAVLIVTAINLSTLAARKQPRPRASRVLLMALLVWIGIAAGLNRFLGDGLSFVGWGARCYAILLSANLTFLGTCVLVPFMTKVRTEAVNSRKRFALFAGIAVLGLSAIVLPSVVVGGDWNGVQQATFAILFWCAAGTCIYHLQRHFCEYRFRTIASVALCTILAYGSLHASAFLWAKPLGTTDDDVDRTLDAYAGQDISFGLAYHLLGNGRGDPCADLCRILREYTNIRDAHAKKDVDLVEKLVPSTSEKPNVFIFVVDSTRPDYLGAYNPQVDFTPNLDSLARDSVVFRNAFTEYMGTSLSEPAIWSGVRLLHAHYLQPFARVDNLEKMARTDGYQFVVSYDEILRQILPPSDEMVKLDQDKRWNAFDVCSTIQETENWIDSRKDPSRPIFFYSQPMNVHQFARNGRPGMSAENWRIRPGFNNRIAYELSQVDECMGNFVTYLKKRALYQNSVLIVTADHGDATGEFGRWSHSLIIYPEVMRVPLIVHVPPRILRGFVYDEKAMATLTDITPSLYELLGHTPILHNEYLGRPLFTHTKEELKSYRRSSLFLASDARAAYGILDQGGRYLYATYDSPAKSFLFDLSSDPNAQHSILTPALEQAYDQRIIQELQGISDFYDYRPDGGLILTSAYGPKGIVQH